MAEEQVDFEPDRTAIGWRLSGALALTAFSGWILLECGFRGSPITVLAMLAMPFALAGVVVFGLCAVHLAEDLLRRGPAVSIGTRGIFDRRISRDWIGWDRFGDVQPCRWPRGTGFHLYLHPGSERTLPLRRRSRLISWVCWVVRPGAYWLFTRPLKTDIPSMAAVIDRFSDDRLRLVKQWEAYLGSA